MDQTNVQALTSTTILSFNNAALLISLVSLALFLARKKDFRREPLPPGPKGKPVIGNMLEIPQVKPWLVYQDWSRKYGDLVHVEALGQSIIVVGSLDVALDLLEKRSSIYSDRPSMPMLDIMDYSFSFGLLPYGADWRRHRKVFHQYLHSHMVPRYHPIQESEIAPLARNLLESPEKFIRHTRVFFATIIMKASYGFEKISYDDALIRDAEALLSAFSEVVVPGRYLVNHIPILRHIPAWFPGAQFKVKAQQMSELSERTVCTPFEMAKKRGRENAFPSMASDLIEDLPAEDDPTREEQETVVKKAIANAYVAGADTTVASGLTTFMALANNPEVQRKAQAEIDAVVGRDRLPTIKDRANLPYVEAFLKEVTRWHTALPLGVPRRCSEDDVYEGKFIPKGAIVIVNAWAINHNPVTYPDPLTFNPERFLKDGKIDPSVPDPSNVAFGFGRRICPGRHFSNDSAFALAATLLTFFNVNAQKDAAGNPIPVELDVTSDLVSTPLPFKCDITPRHGANFSLLQ